MDVIDIVTKLIGNLGFPIFVAVFMMVKNSKETQALTDAINTLANKIDVLMNEARTEKVPAQSKASGDE